MFVPFGRFSLRATDEHGRAPWFAFFGRRALRFIACMISGSSCSMDADGNQLCSRKPGAPRRAARAGTNSPHAMLEDGVPTRIAAAPSAHAARESIASATGRESSAATQRHPPVKGVSSEVLRQLQLANGTMAAV